MDHDYDELARLNKAHLWHPFTQMQDFLAEDPLIIARGEGVYLYDVQGRRYLDGNSSLWVNVHGHRCPEIDQAVRAQLDRVAHCTMLGASNGPAIELAAELVRITPPGLNKVFYSDSGSEAMEIALKIAYQYWYLKGESKRRYFVRLREAYHGDTVGAVSLGGIDLFHKLYEPLLFPTLVAPAPDLYRFPGNADECREQCLEKLDEILDQRRSEIIGVVVEPIIQGAAGILVQPPEFLRHLREFTRQYGVLLIADEVATGFGRTGKLFACEHEGVAPDLMACAKGLSGGYLPLAATLARDEIYEAFLGSYAEQKTFFHGHSYTGNPLGCAAALASLERLERLELPAAAARHGERLRAEFAGWTDLPYLGDARGRGLMWGLELVADRRTRAPLPFEQRWAHRVCRRCRELGLILRPLADVIVFIPPLVTSDDELGEMLAILRQALAETCQEIAEAGGQ